MPERRDAVGKGIGAGHGDSVGGASGELFTPWEH